MFIVQKCMYLNGVEWGGVLCKHLYSCNPVFSHKKFVYRDFSRIMIPSVPLQTWSGPEVSRKLRFPDYMTTAQDRKVAGSIPAGAIGIFQ